MKWTLPGIFVTLLFAASGAFAADAAAGKAKAVVCAACHGAQGISANPIWPNLKGQKAAYIVKQLKAFKAGTRKDPLMGPQAAQLSEADMANVAAHFSGLK
jgi:cytochrome c553